MKPYLALVLPLLLVACAEKPKPPPVPVAKPYLVSGTLYDFNPAATPEQAFTAWSGGEGSVSALASAEALATGSVSAQGEFKLTLPVKPDDSSLVTLEAARRTFNNPACTGSVEISNPQALVSFIDFAVMKGADRRSARPFAAQQKTGSDGLTQTISTTGAVVYANAPTSLTGGQTCGGTLAASASKITVNWNLVKGYNTVLLIENTAADTKGNLISEQTYRTGPLPERWIALSISTVLPSSLDSELLSSFHFK